MRYSLRCHGCGHIYGSNYPSQICERCNSILEVVYHGKPVPKARRNGAVDFWDYEPILPMSKYRHFDVGGTKVIRDRTHKDRYLKMETDNPTRSFKDRGSVVEVAKASEYGFGEVVCASTGNMAYSISYYAKLYGMKAKIFISDNASADKIRDIREVGDASITKVNGDFNEAQRHAIKYAEKNNAFLSGDYCYRKEGQKTVAYEIMAQVPDVSAIIVPVGNATLLSGVFKAIEEMKAGRNAGSTPSIIGVEAAGCNPLERALKQGNGISYTRPRTAADAIAVGFPTFGEQVLGYLKRDMGKVVSVTDRDMEAETKRLYTSAGIIAELAAVAGSAAYARQRRSIKGPVVSVLSGANV